MWLKIPLLLFSVYTIHKYCAFLFTLSYAKERKEISAELLELLVRPNLDQKNTTNPINFVQDKQNCFKAGERKHFKIMCRDT